jgi:hypothetical protein
MAAEQQLASVLFQAPDESVDDGLTATHLHIITAAAAAVSAAPVA